jgi:hypothetical protein
MTNITHAVNLIDIMGLTLLIIKDDNINLILYSFIDIDNRSSVDQIIKNFHEISILSFCFEL